MSKFFFTKDKKQFSNLHLVLVYVSDLRIVFILKRSEQVGAARMDPLPPTPGPLGAWYEHTWNGCSVAPSRRLDADTDSDAAELEQRHEAEAHWNGNSRGPTRRRHAGCAVGGRRRGGELGARCRRRLRRGGRRNKDHATNSSR